MNSMRGVFVGVGVIFVACGGTTSSAGTSLASCTLSAGTYTLSYTAAGSNPSSCPPIADTTTTLPESGSLGEIGSQVMIDGATCSAQGNASTCTESIDCSISEDAVTVQVAITLTLDGDSASGQETATATDSGETVACTYDIALTKS
jgi:hypothetical protein